MSELCLLCGDFVGNFRKNTKDTTDFSKKTIIDTLGTFIFVSTPLQEQLTTNSYICTNCFIKLNNFDEHQMIADRIKVDLINVYNLNHSNLMQYPPVSVKIESMDVPDASPEMSFNDENDEEENYLETEVDIVQIERIIQKKPLKKRIKEEEPSMSKKKKKRGTRKSERVDEKIITHTIGDQSYFQCRVCDRTMKKLSQMKQHVLIHTTERNVCCQECGMMFKTQSCLYSHRKIHMQREKMICDLCGKTFDKKYYLSEHMNAIHLDVRDYTCTVCGAAFARKRSLIKHAFVHQTEADKKVVCEVCGFKSHTRQGMKRHMKTHTGEKNYACEICDKRFACRYNVKAHVNAVHKGIRPKIDESKLRCVLCGRRFPRQKQLRRHLFEEHNMLNYAAEFTGMNL